MTLTKKISESTPKVIQDLQGVSQLLIDFASHFQDKAPLQYHGNLQVLIDWLSDLEGMSTFELKETIKMYRKVVDMLFMHQRITFREFDSVKSKLNVIENLSDFV